MTQQTQHFIVIGNPIAHSLSPSLYQLFAQQFNTIVINYQKVLGDLAPKVFEQQVADFFAQGDNYCAINITAPFKQRAYKLVDNLTERARLAGSVNSIYRLPNGCLEGDNTDGVGLVRDITHNHGYDLAQKKILIIGAGAVVHAILPSIMACEPSNMTIVNRDETKFSQLKQRYPEINTEAYYALAQKPVCYDVIINATPLSLNQQLPMVPEKLLTQAKLCVDLVYQTTGTVFTKWVQAHGCPAVDGLGMLIEQGAENFYRWFRLKPDTTPVFAELNNN